MSFLSHSQYEVKKKSNVIPDFSSQSIQNVSSQPFTSKDQYVYSPFCSLYISYCADKRNLFHDQEEEKSLPNDSTTLNTTPSSTS